MTDAALPCGPAGAPAQQARARRYETLHNWLFLVDLLIVLGTLGALLWRGEHGLSFMLQHALARATGGNPWLVTGGYVAVLLGVYTLALLPYAWWKSWYLEHHYGLSTQTIGNWLGDEAKAFALALTLALLAVELIYALLRVSAWWWLWAAGAWIILQVVLGILFPVVIVPLFYRVTALEDAALQAMVQRAAVQANIRMLGLYRIGLSAKTRKANAAMAGLGRSKRILLGDTLLDAFERPEIVAVLGHEFGHYYHRHVLKMIGTASGAAVLGMGVAHLVLQRSAAALGIHDVACVATLPLVLLALFVFGLVTLPVTNMLSRYYERQADTFALQTTKDAAAFIAAMERLACMNLADKTPPPLIEFLLHSHPSIARRIAAARAWQAAQPSSLPAPSP